MAIQGFYKCPKCKVGTTIHDDLTEISEGVYLCAKCVYGSTTRAMLWPEVSEGLTEALNAVQPWPLVLS